MIGEEEGFGLQSRLLSRPLKDALQALAELAQRGELRDSSAEWDDSFYAFLWRLVKIIHEPLETKEEDSSHEKDCWLVFRTMLAAPETDLKLLFAPVDDGVLMALLHRPRGDYLRLIYLQRVDLRRRIRSEVGTALRGFVPQLCSGVHTNSTWPAVNTLLQFIGCIVAGMSSLSAEVARSLVIEVFLPLHSPNGMVHVYCTCNTSLEYTVCM